jgi:hypothetical protein
MAPDRRSGAFVIEEDTVVLICPLDQISGGHQ